MKSPHQWWIAQPISVLVAVMVLAVSAVAQDPDTSDSPLTFSVSPIKQSYDVDEEVTVRFALANRSNQPVTVNTRFLVNYHHYSEQEVVIRLQAPDGSALTFIPAITAGMPSAEHFITIAPGASATRDYNLSKYFSLSAGGTYRLTANYTNRYAPGWFGAIASEETSFTIK